MQKYWLNREGNERLLLFVLGWASDHHAAEHIRPAGYDILCTYDYRDIEPLTETAPYKEVALFAWSFGVWAAEHIFSQAASRENITKAIALCGTPYPVSDRYGIPLKSLIVTLEGMRRAGTDRFNKRTYGGYYETIRPYLDDRSTEEKIEELAFLIEAAQKEYSPEINWDKAIIGSQDVIFPMANVKAYWDEKGKILDIPHYPFADPAIVTDNL